MADRKTVAAATAIVFTLGLVCFTPLGFAQQPESAVSADSLKKLSIEQLMNLQVTSVSKRPERLSQTASAIQVITQDAKDTQGLLLSGGGGTEQHGFGTVRYGAALGPSVRARFYGRGFDRDATAFPGGQGAADDWYLGQGGFRMDWDASSGSRVTLQGDLYDGRIAQDSGGDIAVSGRNVMAKWSHTLSERSSLAAHLYYDRSHRDIPGVFGEDLDTYDVDVQHRARLGARHDVVWGLGYRNINDRT